MAENTKKAEEDIQKIQTNTLNRLQSITFAFIKSILSVFYRVDISDKVSRDKIMTQLKEENDV